MGCSLRTQTMVAAVICCFITSSSICDEISNRICFFFCQNESDFEPNESDGRGDVFEDLVKVAVYVFCMVSDVWCLFGAQQNKKCLLLPFIIKTGLSILPISSQPIARNTEVGNNHLHSGDQNQTYGYQEQPPAYQLQGYQKRDVEINSNYSSNQV